MAAGRIKELIDKYEALRTEKDEIAKKKSENEEAFKQIQIDLAEAISDADMAGCVLTEADLSDSDLGGCDNLTACRFDETTVWPSQDYLPEDFDTTCSKDLSSLSDEDDNISEDY